MQIPELQAEFGLRTPVELAGVTHAELDALLDAAVGRSPLPVTLTWTPARGDRQTRLQLEVYGGTVGEARLPDWGYVRHTVGVSVYRGLVPW